MGARAAEKAPPLAICWRARQKEGSLPLSRALSALSASSALSALSASSALSAQANFLSHSIAGLTWGRLNLLAASSRQFDRHCHPGAAARRLVGRPALRAGQPLRPP